MKHPGGAGGGAGHSAKHVRSKKHVHGKGKHHPKHHHKGHHQHQRGPVVTVAKGHPHHPRGLALGDALPVCTFEAIAQSLRLAGQRVSDDDVAELWRLAGSREVSIAEALDAAAAYGLAGHNLSSWDYLPAAECELGVLRTDGLDGASFAVKAGAFPPVELEMVPHRPVGQAANGSDHALILGVDYPGPHAVLAAPGGWWSWGSLWSPWTTAVSEAWVVSWLS